MNRFDTVIKGMLVLETEVIRGQIGVKEGKIVCIAGESADLEAERVLDCGSSYVFPGMIDTHVHCFSNPDEGFEPTSRSAAAGGITTFLDMPYDLPKPITDAALFEEKVVRLEQQSVVDIGLWATISKYNGTGQIVPLAEAGAVAFKMSTFETDPYRFPRIPDQEIMQAMRLIEQTGLRAAFHSENNEMIVELIREYQEAGKVYPCAHMETRPPVTETSEVLKLMEFAYWTGVKLHIVHVSHPETVELIKLFRQRGVQVTCETCYPYLLLDVNDLGRMGPRAKMNPPLREPEAVAGMWRHVNEGQVDLICSDHAPWGIEKKEIGNDNIFLSAAGLPGIEILVPLMFDRAVMQGGMSPLQFAKLMSQHPAEVFGIVGKGRIAIGCDADLTVIDPQGATLVDETKLRSHAKLTPFHGKQLQGRIQYTVVRGTIVYDGEDITVEPGFGRFVPGMASKRGKVESR